MPPVSFRKSTVTGVGLEFEWEYPDPTEITYRLAKLADYLEDTQVLSETLEATLQYDMALRFHTETDPTGKPWAPLVRPAKTQQGILQLSGDMRDAAISNAPWTATPVGVFFDTSELPPYWYFQDVRSSHIPRGPRKFIGVSKKAQAEAIRTADGWLAGGIEIGARGFVREARSPAGTFMRIR